MSNELRVKNRKILNSGFSTVEILVAMAILILVITAVLLVSAGSQSLLVSGQTSGEALSQAQGLLENEQALSRKDFKLVEPTSTTVTLAGTTYSQNVTVQTQSDYLTKLVTANVSWTGEHNNPENVQLSSKVTNFENAVGGDTCDSVPTPDDNAWKIPQIKNGNTNFAQLVGDSAGIYPITDMDAYLGKLYVTAGSTVNKPDATLFVFDISNPTAPVLAAGDKADNNPASVAGLNAVAVAGQYAYTANALGANYNTAVSPCNNNAGVNASCGQLQIFDISVNPPLLKYSFEVPNAIGSGGQAIGNSIFYKDGYVYLGLAKTSSGPEFNIIDVHNYPTIPPSLVGSYPVGSAINAITVKGSYAYLATANSAQELLILNISDPTHPVPANPSGGYHAPTSSGNGKSLYTVGDTLYLGKTVNAGSEFYALNNSDPTNTQASNPAPLSQNIGISVDGLIVRNNLAFLLTKSDFEVWQINQYVSPWTISAWAAPSIALATGSTIEPSMDCEGNYFYVGANNAANQGFLYVIAP